MAMKTAYFRVQNLNGETTHSEDFDMPEENAHVMSGGITVGGTALVEHFSAAHQNDFVMSGGISASGTALVEHSSSAQQNDFVMSGGISASGTALVEHSSSAQQNDFVMSGGITVGGTADVSYGGTANKTAYFRLQNGNGESIHSQDFTQLMGQYEFTMSGGISASGTALVEYGSIYSVVVGSTLHTPASERLRSEPDMVTGNVVYWANVVGGTQDDVTVFDDMTYEVALGVTSFDWRVYDGEFGAWATQYIEDAANTNEFVMSGGITVSGTSLVEYSEAPNQNDFTMSGGITAGGTTVVEYFSSVRQNDFIMSGGITAGGTALVDYLPAGATGNEFTMSGGITLGGTADVESGTQEANENSFVMSGGISISGTALVDTGVYIPAPMSGELFLSAQGHNPMQNSRFMPRFQNILGRIVVGSANRFGVLLTSEDESGNLTAVNLDNVSRVTLRLGNQYFIEQNRNAQPANMEWGGDLEEGVIYINSAEILTRPVRPGTYPVRLEIFMTGEDVGYKFPTDNSKWIIVDSW